MEELEDALPPEDVDEEEVPEGLLGTCRGISAEEEADRNVSMSAEKYRKGLKIWLLVTTC